MTEGEQGLTASQEMYLKTIYLLSENRGAVHAKEIALKLKVSKPSVTGALRQLNEKNLLVYERYGPVKLTARGKVAARELVQRFEVLRTFFADVLALDAEEAEKAACDMEHLIPVRLRERLVKFLEHLSRCPRGAGRWSGQIRCFTCDEIQIRSQEDKTGYQPD